MTFDLLLRLTGTLFGLIALGIVACLPLYKWDLIKLTRTPLFIKIIWWVPIFAMLALVLYGEIPAAIAATIIIVAYSIREVAANNGWKRTVARLYFILFIIWTTHLALWFFVIPEPTASIALASIATVSILSDVCAFFMGNYLGKHKLPRRLNSRKSWEGVVGQIIGAGVGGCIVAYILLIPISPLLVLLVGVASAVGDLINSAVKRSLSIKDWGSTIPGHGGVMDRFSSLSLSIAVGFWVITLI
jgi:CDP-diglyceride synthetase